MSVRKSENGFADLMASNRRLDVGVYDGGTGVFSSIVVVAAAATVLWCRRKGL